MTTDSPPPPRRAGAKRWRHRVVLVAALLGGLYTFGYAGLRVSGVYCVVGYDFQDFDDVMRRPVSAPRFARWIGFDDSGSAISFAWCSPSPPQEWNSRSPPPESGHSAIWVAYEPLRRAEKSVMDWWLN